ncbi:hypothetical protein PRIPAC_87437 [Pristionchus pacificus]|uniref:Uncharacterized protein n=1 Tax=Pristionchus pacificus TaxID=54126 RepID=A0A2A6CIN2_PRIPA|nr:hypothetical protein PRIPAC_87437 [Pristionchus pacificus]|eukprot:PDM78094.1 hypothetical protein PRIPAC_30479 [Pristionchus pacificus]
MIQVGDTRRVAQADGRGFSKLEVEERGGLFVSPTSRIAVLFSKVHANQKVPLHGNDKLDKEK